MGFGQAVSTCLGKYITFSGRARRPEYWWFVLFTFVAGVVATVLDVILGTGTFDGGMVQSLVSISLLLPTLGVTWRRMHDVGRPGYHALLPMAVMFVVAAVLVTALDGRRMGPGSLSSVANPAFWVFALATLGAFALVVKWLASPGQPGPNRFGPEPQPA